MRLLLLDNYDSFTWNLAHYLEQLGAEVELRLNDEVDCAWVREQGFDAVVLSPGPGRPEEAGITPTLVRQIGPRTPLLGVCLGHQAIGLCFGARIVTAPTLVHGKTSRIWHDGSGVFAGLPNPFEATRYHSLIVDRESVPPELVINAWTREGVIMGLRHRKLPLHGVQFHPESILTRQGKPLLANFLEGVCVRRRRRTSAA